MSRQQLLDLPDTGNPGDGGDDDGNRKLVVTLGIEAAQATRGLAQTIKVTPVEAVRRGLSLLQLLLSLKKNEELVIRNKDDGSFERVRFQWNLG